jgi:G3E family GTPase
MLKDNIAVMQTIPVTILSGFLGAGKSTLINDLLSDPQMADTAIVVNEFGDIGIDHELIRVDRRKVTVTTLGCICCTAGSDIRTSLYELHEAAAKEPRLAFSRVIVETTGLADPAPLINQLVPGYAPASGLRDHVVARRFRMAGFVCAVDATTAEQTLDAHFECLKQIAFADRIVLTKTDLKNGDDEQLVTQLSRLNPTADILDRHDGDFDIASLFQPRGYVTAERGEDVEGWLALERVIAAEPTEQGAVRHNRHDAGIASFALTHDVPIASDDLANFLDFLKIIAGARLLRLKGLVCVSDDPDRPFVLHVVQHNVHPAYRLDGWPSEDRRTRLVLITNGLDHNTVTRLFTTVADPKSEYRQTGPKVIVVAATLIALITAGVLMSIYGLAKAGIAATVTTPPISTSASPVTDNRRGSL